jgi:monovalent cation:H+ antiporter-2, CPA2 family
MGLIVFAAALALGLALRTRLPTSALAIFAGVALQVLAVPVDGQLVRDGLLMAGTFLVFSVGAEIERNPLIPYYKTAIALVTMMTLLTALGGVLLWAVLGIDAWTAAYWVVALSASSTLLVFEMLRRRQQFFEPIGRLVSATSLMQDFMVIAALSVFAMLSPTVSSPALVFAGVVALAAMAWVVARWVAPFFMQRLKLDDEERLLFVLLVLFAFAAVARSTGGVLVTGAYFAGLSISKFPVGDLSRGYLKSFSDFFTTTFYVMVGMLITFPSFPEILAEVIFVTAILLVRPVVLLPLVRRTGLTVRSSIDAVTLLAQAGELAVIVAIVGMELGHIGENTTGAVVAVVATTMALSPWISSERVVWKLTHWYPFQSKHSLRGRPSGHVILLGYGETGRALVAELSKREMAVVVIDDDPAVLESAEAPGMVVLRGDAADPTILREAGADRARAIVSTMRRPEDNARLLAGVQGAPVVVRVFSEGEAETIRRLGGYPVAEAELAAEAICDWYDSISSPTGSG